MFPPGEHDESTTLVGYLASNLQALRHAAYGLTEEQARLQPCRSSLSVGGLIKHATYVLGGLERRERDVGGPTPEGFAAFVGSFTLTEEETLDGVLAAFDEAVEHYLARVGDIDPGSPGVEPVAPWDGVLEPTPITQRYHLVHHVEEIARHAGHADIIREQIDGATAIDLRAGALGLPGNDFVTPWQPPAR